MRRALLAVLGGAVLCGASASARAGETWVVDDDGPANYRDLPEAIAGARDGDTLVLRAGRYSAAAWIGKGLAIIGAGSASTVIERRSGEGPFLAVSGVASDRTVLLSGVTGIGRGSSLEISQVNGLLVIADLVVDGRDGASGPRLDQCARAYLARVAVIPPLCALDGGAAESGAANRPTVNGAANGRRVEAPLGGPLGGPQGRGVAAGVAFGPAAAGLSLSRGSYSLCQVVAIGAVGRHATSPRGLGQEGGAGLLAHDATLELALCDFVGGRGGAALWDELAPFCPEAAIAGNGGPGVALAGHCVVRAAGAGAQSFAGGNGGLAARNPWEECHAFAGSGGAGLRLDLEPGFAIERPRRIDLIGGVAGEGVESRAGKPGRAVEPPQDLVADDLPIATLALDAGATVGGRVTLRLFGPLGDRVRFYIGALPHAVALKQTRGFAFHLGNGAPLAGHEADRIGDDGTLVIEAELPAEAELVGKLLAVQALVTPRSGRGRDSVLTNVELLVIGDGTAAAAKRPIAPPATSGAAPAGEPSREP
ncbi:MAG: hypothetical protein JNL90_07850 [Planctomycetes bacterium]|nr:hypothetical protein [Planctomycetota bacterium]